LFPSAFRVSPVTISRAFTACRSNVSANFTSAAFFPWLNKNKNLPFSPSSRRSSTSVGTKDLAYLEEGTEHFFDYLEAVQWPQDFARTNRGRSPADGERGGCRKDPDVIDEAAAAYKSDGSEPDRQTHSGQIPANTRARAPFKPNFRPFAAILRR
jgi:hypothetical protein